MAVQRALTVAVACVVAIVASIVVLFLFRRRDPPCVDQKTHPSLSDIGFEPVSPTWSNDAVPKIIHHTAYEKERWPPLWHTCYASFLQLFPEPEYKHVMWSDDDIDEFVKSRYPGFYAAFAAYPKSIHRIDVVRYLFLYAFGGIYADMDVIAFKNFYALLPAGRTSIAESPHPGEGYQNALMASPARHPFWHYVMQDVLANMHRCHTDAMQDVLLRTGPQVIVRAVKLAPAEFFNSLPANRFSPSSIVHDGNEADIRFAPGSDVYAAHLGTFTWDIKKQ